METLWNLYVMFSFVITLLISESVIGLRLPKRKHFWCFGILGIAFAFLVSYLVQFFPQRDLFVLVMKYFLIFLASYAFIFGVYKVNPMSYIIVGSLGYCVQHISYQIYSILTHSVIRETRSWYMILLLFGILAIVNAAMYFIAIRRMRKNRDIEVNNHVQIYLSLLSVVITVGISLGGILFSHEDDREIIIICLFSILSCVLAIALQLALIKFKEDEHEMDILKHMVHAAKTQMYLSKENIDIINIKCHDLRHQIHSLRGQINEGEIKAIDKAIDLYDNDFKTKNDALDIVLTEKSLLCKNENIRLTCLVDGSKLNFMCPSDIYSFFGNAIDNAREAMSNLPIEYRSLSLSSEVQDDIFVIRIENYTDRQVVFVNGMPQTTKTPTYHGFGTKSMKIIAEKYNGAVSFETKGKLFLVKLLLPLQR